MHKVLELNSRIKFFRENFNKFLKPQKCIKLITLVVNVPTVTVTSSVRDAKSFCTSVVPVQDVFSTRKAVAPYLTVAWAYARISGEYFFIFSRPKFLSPKISRPKFLA